MNEACPTCMKQRNGDAGAMHTQEQWNEYHSTRFDFDIDMVRRGVVPPGGLHDPLRPKVTKEINEPSRDKAIPTKTKNNH